MPCTERYWSKLLHRLGRVAYVSDAASASPPTLSFRSCRVDGFPWVFSRASLLSAPAFSSSLAGRRRRAGGRGGGGGGGTVAAGCGWLLFCLSGELFIGGLDFVEVFVFGADFLRSCAAGRGGDPCGLSRLFHRCGCRSSSWSRLSMCLFCCRGGVC